VGCVALLGARFIFLVVMLLFVTHESRLKRIFALFLN